MEQFREGRREAEARGGVGEGKRKAGETIDETVQGGRRGGERRGETDGGGGGTGKALTDSNGAS